MSSAESAKRVEKVKALSTTAADNICICIFFFFFEGGGGGGGGEENKACHFRQNRQVIHMKCQVLFSPNNTGNAQVTHSRITSPVPLRIKPDGCSRKCLFP